MIVAMAVTGLPPLGAVGELDVVQARPPSE